MSRVHVVIAASILMLSVLALSYVAHAQSESATPTAPPLPSATESSLPVHFWITNQALSQTVKAVQITLLLDGQVLFDQSMEVGDQHHVAVVDQTIPNGIHTLTVQVGEPYNLSTDAALDINGEQWIIAAFWLTPQPENVQARLPHITVDAFDTPPAIQ